MLLAIILQYDDQSSLPTGVLPCRTLLDQEPVPHNGKWHAAKSLHPHSADEICPIAYIFPSGSKKSVVEEDLWHTKITILLQFWEKRSNTWRQTMPRLKLQTLQELDWSTSMKRPNFGASNGLEVFSIGLASCVLNQCSLPPLHWHIFKRAKINSTRSKQNAKELAQGRANWCQCSVWLGWSR